MMMVTGEDGTGGRMPIGTGRRLTREVGRGEMVLCGGSGIWKVDRTAVAGGGGGTLNDVFPAGAEGGGRIEGRAVRGVGGSALCGVTLVSSSGE
jgi:hypothetical protein